MQEVFAIQMPLAKVLAYDVLMHPGGRPTKYPRSALGQRLAQAREQAGLSQTQLADKLNTTQTTVAYWERHATCFRSDVLVKLSGILDVSTDELLGTRPPRQATAKPIGKARQLFEAVSKMPRRQQEKIFDILQPFVTQHGNGHKKAA